MGGTSRHLVLFALSALTLVVLAAHSLELHDEDDLGFLVSPDDGSADATNEDEDDAKTPTYLASGFDSKVEKYFGKLQKRLRKDLRNHSKLNRVRGTVKAYYWILSKRGRGSIWKNMKHAMFTSPPRTPEVSSASTNEKWYGNRVETGTVDLKMNKKTQTVRGKVSFKAAYDVPPQVSMSIRGFAIGDNEGKSSKQQERKALDASVTSVTASGFEYLIQGWGETVENVKAVWLAYGNAIKTAPKEVQTFAKTYEKLYRTNFVKDQHHQWKEMEKTIKGFYDRRYKRMRDLATQVNAHKGYWKQYMAIHKRLLTMNKFITNQEKAEKEFSNKINSWRDKVVKEMKVAPITLLSQFHRSLYYDKKLKKIMHFVRKDAFSTFLDLRKRMKDAWKNAADLVKAITELETGVRDYSLHLTDRVQEGKKIKEAQLDEGAIDALRQRGLQCHCTKATGDKTSKCVCADPGAPNAVSNEDHSGGHTPRTGGLSKFDVGSITGSG